MNDEPIAERRPDDPAVSVVAPGEGETILLGTTRMRVLEDGRNTSTASGWPSRFWPRTRQGRRSTATPSTTKGSTSSPA